MNNSKNELRRNPISGTTILVSPDRQKAREQLMRKNPRDWSKVKPGVLSGQDCPFETGHEKMTPPEYKAYRDVATKPDEPGWRVRAVPNLAPAVDPSIPCELLQEEKKGPFLVMPAFGYHYVIVESTEHNGSLSAMSKEQVRDIVFMWRDLISIVGGDRNIKYPFLFENFGPLAGASQPHPHSQLVGLPVIPPRVLGELRGAHAYFDDSKQCFYCTEIEWELRLGERLVEQTDNFFAWCPFTSKTPYQVTISPKEHMSYLGNISIHPLDKGPLTEFSYLLQRVLQRMKLVLCDPDYNLYFHTAPSNQPEMHFYHWHCQIEPLTEAIVAGLEKGAEVFINPRSPENTAKDLREVFIP